MSRFFGAFLFVVYLVIGLVVAANHNYLDHLGSAKPIVSAVAAVVLWPLILFGVNLHIK
jgi:hypothetical protein